MANLIEFDNIYRAVKRILRQAKITENKSVAIICKITRQSLVPRPLSAPQKAIPIPQQALEKMCVGFYSFFLAIYLATFDQYQA